jgi:predicted DNA-binding transcriptional regulator AlpA
VSAHQSFQSLPAEADKAKGYAVVPESPRELLRISEVCARLGVSRFTWHGWVKSGLAPAPVPNVPGHPRWRVREIEGFERGAFAVTRRVSR